MCVFVGKFIFSIFHFRKSLVWSHGNQAQALLLQRQRPDGVNPLAVGCSWSGGWLLSGKRKLGIVKEIEIILFTLPTVR